MAIPELRHRQGNMRLKPVMFLLALLTVTAFAAGCEKNKADPNQAAGPQAKALSPPADRPPATHVENPPASPENRPLLLLDDASETNAPPTTGADNSRCLVCHLNLAEEELALIHARADIGCAKCHGPSDAHIADESWASGGNGTAPDIMFPRDKIKAACLECHPKNKIDPDLHQDFFAGTSAKSSCTDCHGKHRLVTRQCK